MVQAGREVGGGAIEPLLAPLLRKKQSEEYMAAFAAAGVSAGVVAPPPAPAAAEEGGAPAKGKGKKKEEKGAKGKKGGKGAVAEPAPLPPVAEVEGSGTCQFCGGCGPNAAEATLDLHYWQACPMLTSCGRCQQVIEIATLTEHLLEECDARGEYAPCAVCGDAVLAAEMQAHTAAAACRAAPDPTTASRCALCHADIAPDKEGWLAHLLDAPGCPCNPRTNGAAPAEAPTS
jgi:hypothetical protein